MLGHESSGSRQALATAPARQFSVELQAGLAARNRAQVRIGERFAFGRNWRHFLARLNESRIAEAEKSLCAKLHVGDLRGQSFLDVGAGSGLFSLAATRRGATRVHAFDFDPECVACTAELKRRYAPTWDPWTIECGDILSHDYLRSLGQFDVVYSWGVLHQTGDLWRALENVGTLVAPQGLLFISIYNQQPLRTPFWRAVKRAYNWLPRGCRWPLVVGYLGLKTPLLFVRDILLGRNPWDAFRGVGCRGMTLYYDAVDWIGGYPHETATPEAIFRFFRDRRFQLVELATVNGGSGCNEFVFRRQDACPPCAFST